MVVPCPFCGAQVEPWANAWGERVCPRCLNRGATPAPPTRAAWIPVATPTGASAGGRAAWIAVAVAVGVIVAAVAAYLGFTAMAPARGPPTAVLVDRDVSMDFGVASWPFVLVQTSIVSVEAIPSNDAAVELVVYMGTEMPARLDEGTWSPADGHTGTVTLGPGPYGVAYLCQREDGPACTFHLRIETAVAPPDAVAELVPLPKRDLEPCSPQPPHLAAPLREGDPWLDQWQPATQEERPGSWVYASRPAGTDGTSEQGYGWHELHYSGPYVRGVGIYGVWGTGTEGWQLSFTAPDSCPALLPGLYANLTWQPDRPLASVKVQQPWIGCYNPRGMVLVDRAAYDAFGRLEHVTLRLVQACDEAETLYVKVIWNAEG